MERYEKIGLPRREIIFNNFLGGLAWGLGTTLGLSLVLAILGFFLSRVDFIPVIGDFISRILNVILSENPALLE